MYPTSFVSLRLGLVAVAPLAWCVSHASAQMIVYPELIAAHAALPGTREAAREDPAMEPVVSLASLVLALGESPGDGSLTLGPRAARAAGLRLTTLLDTPVPSRAEAGPADWCVSLGLR
jgi:hypothetical protein